MRTWCKIAPLLLGLCACGSNGPDSAKREISLVSFNILHGILNEDPAAQPYDRFPERLDRVLEELARRRPTAVLLQEIFLQTSSPRYPDVMA